MDTPRDEKFRQHYSSQFNPELANLRSRVVAMGGVVEKQIADAVTALHSGNENMARSVIGGDLHVNALEVYLDEECGRILARRHPAAGDLRLVFAVIKTVTDIERIGDQAKGVARMAIRMAQAAPDQAVPQLRTSARSSAKWCTTRSARSPAWMSIRRSRSNAPTSPPTRNTRPSCAS